MSKNDNSFEQQMLDFYGIDNIGEVIQLMSGECPIKERALMQIGFDIVMKYDGISKEEMEKEKNKLQIELYNQLEKDRSNANK